MPDLRPAGAAGAGGGPPHGPGAPDGHPHHGHEHHDGDRHEHHDHDHDHDHDEHGGLRHLLADWLRPHSHDQADATDPVLEGSRRGLRALGVSLVVLLGTAGLQVTVYVLSGSVALLADTIHNAADALTAVPLGVAFLIGRRPPTRRYTYGFGRAEDLAGVAVVLIIAASSVLAGYAAVQRLVHPDPPSHLVAVALAGLIGFAGNEAVAVYRIRVGRSIGSAALVADGLHARTDGLTSLAVVVGAAGTALGWAKADPVVGLAITVMILLVLWQAARDVYRRLMDAVDPDLVTRAGQVLAEVPGVVGVGPVQLRWVGHALRAEACVRAPGTLSLVEAHEVAEDARHRLLHDVRRLSDAIIHVDPVTPDGTDPHAALAHHTVAGRVPS